MINNNDSNIIIHKEYEKYLVKEKYSTYQMDNFYKAFANGEVKQSGVMNYMQHLFIAQKCFNGAKVLDVCCGKALSVPLLKKYAPNISKYVGVDISSNNLNEASSLIHNVGNETTSFDINLIEGDVTQLNSLIKEKFDIIIYTSALEHLDKSSAVTSIQQVSYALADNGTLYLSTPRTPKDFPGKVQYRCHIYEWDIDELEEIFKCSGLQIIDSFGILPPSFEILNSAIEEKYGDKGLAWFVEMKERVPESFLGPVVATCFPRLSREIMFVCKKLGG